MDWRPDILGEGFEMCHVTHPDDYSGQVRSTVIRRRPARGNGTAIIYVHGFSDYFLQREMAEMFTDHHYAFYAVDLRKYGRSLTPWQKMFEVRDLYEYFPDIDSALDAAVDDGNDRLVLLGHSTGGLTASLYVSEQSRWNISGLMLNSPFLDWNLPSALKRFGIPVVSALGRIFPKLPVKQTPDSGYAESLHSAFGGEWDYRREWKPDILPDPDAGWVRAIQCAQQSLRRRSIDVPVLLMHSADSVRKGDDRGKYHHADAILDVEGISRYGRMLGPDVTEVSFEGGLHDLVLSSRKVRERVYETMLSWLRNNIIS